MKPWLNDRRVSQEGAMRLQLKDGRMVDDEIAAMLGDTLDDIYANYCRWATAEGARMMGLDEFRFCLVMRRDCIEYVCADGTVRMLGVLLKGEGRLQ